MSKLNLKSSVLGILSFVFLLSPYMAYCDLGDTIAQAKSRASSYYQKYGALDPLFKSGKDGKVIWECWAAPARMWSQKEAMEFAKELVPSSLKNEILKRGTKDGTSELYTYSDGTMIIFSVFDQKYVSVEVRAPGYDGPRC